MKNMKNPKPNLSKGETSNGRTCEKKEYYCNQCRQSWCCSNNGRRKLHQRREPKTLQDDPTLQHSRLITQSTGLKKETYFLKN